MIKRAYEIRKDDRCTHIDYFTVPINDRYQKRCQNVADYRIFYPGSKNSFYACITHAQACTIEDGYEEDGNDIIILRLVSPEEKQAILDELEQKARQEELHSMPYRDYLQTPEWKERRKRIVKHAGHRCQVCNSSERLNVHHRTYERRGYEEDRDLIVLCWDCHQIFHENGSLVRSEA